MASLLHQLSAVCSVFLVTFRESCAVCDCFSSAVKVYVEITELRSSYTCTDAKWVEGLFWLVSIMLPELFVYLEFVILYIPMLGCLKDKFNDTAFLKLHLIPSCMLTLVNKFPCLILFYFFP